MVNEHRNSNIELLRLVLMFFILMHHYLSKGGGLNAGFYDNVDLDLEAVFLDPFFYVGVNCFVLISGYFGIKFKFKGLYKLFVQCAFYGLLFYLLHLYLDNAKIGKSVIDNSLLVLSNPPGWWFVRVYVYLYLLSPILNKAIENISQKQFKIALVFLAVLNLYFGFLRQSPFNPDGYNIANFIFLYFIGRYIKLYRIVNRFGFWKCFMGYLVCSALMGLLTIAKNTIFSFDSVLLNIHAYNNPLLILAAVFLLLAFASIQIPYSKVINCFSFSALSIYLITENSYFDQWYYPYVGHFVKSLMPMLAWLCLLAVAIVTMICCILLDKVRLLIMIPLDRLSNRILEKLDHRYLDVWGSVDE